MNTETGNLHLCHRDALLFLNYFQDPAESVCILKRAPVNALTLTQVDASSETAAKGPMASAIRTIPESCPKGAFPRTALS